MSDGHENLEVLTLGNPLYDTTPHDDRKATSRDTKTTEEKEIKKEEEKEKDSQLSHTASSNGNPPPLRISPNRATHRHTPRGQSGEILQDDYPPSFHSQEKLNTEDEREKEEKEEDSLEVGSLFPENQQSNFEDHTERACQVAEFYSIPRPPELLQNLENHQAAINVPALLPHLLPSHIQDGEQNEDVDAEEEWLVQAIQANNDPLTNPLLVVPSHPPVIDQSQTSSQTSVNKDIMSHEDSTHHCQSFKDVDT